MAGGKETPRQKMIGMMYLVLTALLALNVSKEIIRAFVTINDKLDSSGEVIGKSSTSKYLELQSKRLALVSTKGDTKNVDFWIDKTDKLKKRTALTVHYILGESNEMIKEAEGGKDWVAEKDENDLITELKSLLDISAMDNYDIPTNRFIGGNPLQPIAAGLAIRDSIHAYRNDVLELMATYDEGQNKWSFSAPDNDSDIDASLATANPKDTSILKQLFNALTLPENIEVKEAGQIKSMPWPSVMFDHAPIVAACAMMTSLKVDVLNGESLAAEFMSSKVNAPPFNFNKIEPLAFARTGYINAGDSLDLSVMIAAYDSTEIPKIKYGINADTLPENWKEVTGKINLPGDSPGEYKVKGQIGVKGRSGLEWKNWKFRYQVGKPSGAVSLPKMNVLYRGYENEVVGAVSGYTGYNLSMTNGSISKKGEYWIAKPGSGRECSISISGIAEDGSSANVGTFKYRVSNLPAPNINLGNIINGNASSVNAIKGQSRIFAKYPPEIPLEATFRIEKYEVFVSGLNSSAKGTGNVLDRNAKSKLKQATKGGTVVIKTSVIYPNGSRWKLSGTYYVE